MNASASSAIRTRRALARETSFTSTSTRVTAATTASPPASRARPNCVASHAIGKTQRCERRRSVLKVRKPTHRMSRYGSAAGAVSGSLRQGMMRAAMVVRKIPVVPIATGGMARTLASRMATPTTTIPVTAHSASCQIQMERTRASASARSSAGELSLTGPVVSQAPMAAV
jgi:hypothetical protein